MIDLDELLIDERVMATFIEEAVMEEAKQDGAVQAYLDELAGGTVLVEDEDAALVWVGP